MAVIKSFLQLILD